jgi:glutamate racemase
MQPPGSPAAQRPGIAIARGLDVDDDHRPDDRPIGMFDSGFGGLTVARAVIDLLPHEHVVYFGDTGRYPYGPREPEEVRRFAREITDVLVRDHDVKVVIVACNTAAAAALDELQATCPVPVLGVIDPGVRALVSATRNGRVGVIGTVGTIRSGAYQRAVAASGARVHLACAACPGFVEFVERGQTEGDEVAVLAERLLAPMVDAKVDTLLLGCTHYPYLARVIGGVMGRDVVLVSSADETAFDVAHRLARGSLAVPAGRPRDGGAPGRLRFISSGDIAWFEDLGRRLLGPELAGAEAFRWDPAPGRG